jgi:hypothetical protein
MSRLAVLEDLPVHCTHEQWEQDHPADLEHAWNLAQAAIQNGADAPSREFPCKGNLRVLLPGVRAKLLLLACDQCDFETSTPKPATSNADEFIESATTRDDEWGF